MKEKFLLTQYSHGAGCGCKISPAVLDQILQHGQPKVHFPALMVGNEERDDAAVMDLGNGNAIISTTDFFMPIVDDPADFGRIASVNAISDIYAMGGKPLMAIAILGWPVNTLPAWVANEVVEGSRRACAEVGIPLAGGHSIDSPEPIFGLAVTGIAPLRNIKKNGGATPGCELFLTKPLGVGILSTAQKKGKLQPEHTLLATSTMLEFNLLGEQFGELAYVKAMTDVTGFGLLGHLSEMCEASNLSAKVFFNRVPFLDLQVLDGYLEAKCIPGGTLRNWDSYGHKIEVQTERQKHLLCDPQTSGGLLVAVEQGASASFIEFCRQRGKMLQPLGVLEERREMLVEVVDGE